MGFDNIDVKTTLRYTHPSPENKRKAVEDLAAVFGGGSEKEDLQVPDMKDLSYSRTHN